MYTGKIPIFKNSKLYVLFSFNPLWPSDAVFVYGRQTCLMFPANVWRWIVKNLSYFNHFSSKSGNLSDVGWIPFAKTGDAIWLHKFGSTSAQVKWHQAITWTNIDSSVRFCGIHLRAISQWETKLLYWIMNLKIIFLKLLSHLPGADDLTMHYWHHAG